MIARCLLGSPRRAIVAPFGPAAAGAAVTPFADTSTGCTPGSLPAAFAGPFSEGSSETPTSSA